MDLTDDERALILVGLFELCVTPVEDDEKRAHCNALAVKLGGDPDAMCFGAPVANAQRSCRCRAFRRCAPMIAIRRTTSRRSRLR